MTEWTPEAQERFFSALYEEVAEDDDQPEDVAQKVASAVGGVTRREMLAGAGILGGGALLGSGGTAALTGDAQAAASTTDGDGDIGTPANPEDVYADALAVFDGANNQIGSFDETGIQTPSVNTDEGDITNETFVKATLTSTKSGLASDTYHDIADNEVADNRDELDGSFNFVPDKTGWYKVTIVVNTANGGDQDEYELVVYDNDADTYEERLRAHSSGAGYGDAVTLTLELTSGTSYAVQIKNRYSTFVLAPFRETNYTIEKAVVHP